MDNKGGQGPPPQYATQQQPPVAYNQYNAQPVTTTAAGYYNVQPMTSVTVVRTRPNNYLVMAILVTACCCLPFGIVGIVYSVDSSSKFNAGDTAGAVHSAKLAKNWSIAGLVCGIVLIVVVIIVQVIVLSSLDYTYTYNY